MSPKSLLRLPWRCLSRIFKEIRGICLTRLVTKKSPGARISITDPFLPVTIKIGKGASFILNGKLTFDTWAGSRERVFIQLGEGSKLTIDGDFSFGNGCRIIIMSGGQLHIGGRLKESASGITERSMIMVRKRIIIGKDLICAWGVFITDCDWHEMTGVCNTEDTIIGDHVWITPNCSILKGSRIGNGCIVATGAVVHEAIFADGCLLGGMPASVLAQDREWARDLKPLS